MVFAIAWLVLSILSSAWAMATPVSGAPDEPAHIIKAASVVRGEFIGTPSAHGHTVEVPQYIASAHAVTCFAFQPDVSADCADSIPMDSAEAVSAETTAGLYNPAYYLLVGWPSLIVNTEAGIYLMRIVSGIVASAFLALCFLLVSTWSRRVVPTMGLIIACTPMVLFLNGVVNPNSLETAATLAAFVALLSVLLEPEERLLRLRLVVLVLASAFAVNARGLSPLWLAIVLAIPLVLLGGPALGALLRRRAILAAIAAVLAAVGLAIAWTLSSSSLTAGVQSGDAPVTNFPGVGASAITGFTTILRETFGYANGLVGQFGWLDTTAPAGTLFSWAALTGALLLAAVGFLRGRALVVFGLLAAAFVLVPAIVQGLYVTRGGFIWQGRYALPLFVCLVVGTAALLTEKVSWTRNPVRIRLTGAVLVTAVFAQYLAFAVVLQRYAVGNLASLRDFYLAPDWQPPGGVAFWLVLYLATLVGGAVVVQRWLGQEQLPEVPESHPARVSLRLARRSR